MPIKINDMAKKRSSIGCLFWIALILLVVVVFFFNRERIRNVLESTGFMSVISRNAEEEEETPGESPEESAEDEENLSEEEGPALIESSEESGEDTAEEITVETVTSEEREDQAEEESPAGETRLRNAKLYFIDVDDSGRISLQAVTRPIHFNDSPLTETLNVLLKGPVASELNQDLISLIPDNTRLLSVRVDNSIAYINFSEDFQFNSFGPEGHRAQLKQIVYTATEFSTVDSVQFLIDGKKLDYLGPEGVFIGQPLTRSSL